VGWGRSRSLKMASTDRSYHDLLLTCHCMYSSILYHFRVIWRWIISWPWNLANLGYVTLKVIVNGTIQYIAYEFVFVFHCNYGHIFIVSEIKRDIGRRTPSFANLRVTFARLICVYCTTESDPSPTWRCNRFCKKSSGYSKLKRVTEKQTDGQTDGQTQKRS